MEKRTLAKSEALSEAMRLLDPENTLTPGGPERRVVAEETLEWIDEMGPEKALERIKQDLPFLKTQIAFLATM